MKKERRASEISLKIILLTLFVFIVTVFGFVMIFQNYKDSITDVQKENMLSTVRVVAQSMERYYNEKVSFFQLYFQGQTESGDIDEFLVFEKDYSSGYLVDEHGKIVYEKGKDYDAYIPDLVQKYNDRNIKETVLEPPVLIGENSYTQFLIKKIDNEEVPGHYVIASLEMEVVYEKIIQPIKVGENGYSMVKNFDGIILMHKQKDQIGIDAIEGRKEKYKDDNLDLEDLERWFEVQKEKEEDCDIIQSYWWDEEIEHEQVKKMVAFNQIRVGEEIWIVNCTLDYNELERPIMLGNIWGGFFAILMTGVFGFFIYLFINSENKANSMKQEMNYLQELNSAFEDLRKSEEMLRHADKVQTLGVMTGMISHEFNNFLTPIMLYSEMMQMDPSLSEENRRCLEEITESARKSSDLTKELSRFGHRDTGLYHHVAMQIGSEITSSLSMIAKTIPTNIQLKQEIQQGEYYVKMPMGLISQTLMNICTNALHAMKDKGGVLTVCGRAIENQRYLLSIEDTGIGMPEWVVTQIFNPFYTTKESGQGTGLGLAIVQELIHQVKGEISVTSKENEGSRFSITFPLCEKEEPKRKKSRKPQASTQKLMILEDSATVAKALRKSLEKDYKKISIYSHPSQALAELKKDMKAYQIVITSYKQEFMSGIEFASIIRNLGFEGRIIMIYAYLDKDITWYLENRIIDAALEKPVTHEELEEVLAEKEENLKIK